MADESKFDQFKGNVKETVGNVTDNKELEKEGQQDKATGKAKEVVKNVKDKINEYTGSNNEEKKENEDKEK